MQKDSWNSIENCPNPCFHKHVHRFHRYLFYGQINFHLQRLFAQVYNDSHSEGETWPIWLHSIWVPHGLAKANCTFWCPTDSVRNPVIPVDSGGMALESIGMGPESAGMRPELPESAGMRPEWLNSAGMPPEFIMREGLRQYQNHLIGHIWYKRHIYYIYYYL